MHNKNPNPPSFMTNDTSQKSVASVSTSRDARDLKNFIVLDVAVSLINCILKFMRTVSAALSPRC